MSKKADIPIKPSVVTVTYADPDSVSYLVLAKDTAYSVDTKPDGKLIKIEYKAPRGWLPVASTDMAATRDLIRSCLRSAGVA